MIFNGDALNNNLTGTTGDDTISGFGGADNLLGAPLDSLVDGNDIISGGDQDDTIDGRQGNDILDGGLGSDTIYGFDGNDQIYGNQSGDHLYGEAGEDSFFLSGAITLAGIVVDGGTETDTVWLDQGTVQLGTTLAFANVEILKLYFTTQLQGTAGNDVYDFRPFSLSPDQAGVPFLNLLAGAGNDTVYSTDDVPDLDNLHVLSGGTGNDTLYGGAAPDWLKGDENDDLLFGGGGADKLFGGSGNDTMSGNEESDYIEGGSGNDVIEGGFGFDEMHGGDDNDKITGSDGDSAFGEGGDDHLINTFVNSGQTWDGGTGTDAIDFSFDTLEDNWIMDLGAASFLIWGVTFQNFEHLYGSQGNDTIIGSEIGNDLRGSNGNDIIRGGLGADTINGGIGIDTVDFSDKAVAVSLKLSAAGTATARVGGVAEDTVTAIENATGGSGNDRFTGTAAVNVLTGNSGNDVLNGLGNNDVLNGGSGNDVLDGGIGNDLMLGGDDNDIYFVDRSTDRVVEAIDEGIDTVYASASYTLRPNSSIEILRTISDVSIFDIDLSGNNFANSIVGNDGDNVLNGNQGADTMDGRAGEDSFVFSTPLLPSNIDTIVSFSAADDTIVLSASLFTALGAGPLAAGALNFGVGATQTDDRIIYNTSNGNLRYDPDGDGVAAAVTFARMTTLSGPLTEADFVIV